MEWKESMRDSEMDGHVDPNGRLYTCRSCVDSNLAREGERRDDGKANVCLEWAGNWGHQWRETGGERYDRRIKFSKCCCPSGAPWNVNLRQAAQHDVGK